MGTSIGDLYATVSLKNGIDPGAREATASMKRMMREIESTAGTSIANISKGLFDRNGLGGSGRLRDVYGGLGVSLKSMTDEQKEVQRYLAGSNGSALSTGSRDIASIRTMSRAELDNIGAGPAISMAGLGKSALAVRTTFEGLSLISKVWNGDLENIKDTIDKIPIVGKVAVGGANRISEWLGWGAEVRRFEEQARNQDRLSAQMRHRSEVMHGTRKDVGLRVGALSREAGGIGRVGLDAELYALDMDRQERLEALARQRKSTIKNAGFDPLSKEGQELGAQFDRQRDAEIAVSEARRGQILKMHAREEGAEVMRIEAEMGRTRLEMQGQHDEARVRAIEDAGKAAAGAERNAGRERLAKLLEEQTELAVRAERLAIDQEREKTAAAKREETDRLAKEHARDLRRLDNQLLTGRLGLSGQDLAASVAGISFQYDEEIAEARAGGKNDVADRLGALKGQALRGVIGDAYRAYAGSVEPIQAIDSRVYGGDTPASSREQQLQAIEQVLQDEKAGQELTNRLLERILNKLGEDNGVNLRPH